MPYEGDIRVGAILEFDFNTVNTSSVPTTLAGTPSLAVYKNSSTTESTAGITLTVDHDSVTGRHHVKIDTSADGTFYAAANEFSVVLAAGTVAGTSVVGARVAGFSIENRSALMPTTAGRKLDVSSGGEAGLDWANVGSPTTTLNLSGTTFAITQRVDVETIKTQAVTCAAGVTVGANLGTTQPLNFTGTGASALAQVDIIDAAGTAWGVSNVHIGVSRFLTMITLGGGGNQVFTPNALYFVPTALGMASANLDTQLSGINAKTTNLPASPAATGDAMTLTSAYDAAKTAASAGLIVSAVGTLGTLSATIKRWIQLLMRKDTAIATDYAADVVEINADEGSGAGSFDNTTDSEQAIRDHGDVAWITGSGGGGGSGSGDWTSTEKEQIRYRLGVDGDTAVPATNTVHLDLGGMVITINSTVDTSNGDQLNLVQGDDHTEGDRLPTWVITGYTGPSMVGATGVLRLLRIARYLRHGTDVQADLEVAAAISQVGTTLTITAPITSVQSALLDSTSIGEVSHEYQLVGTASGKDHSIKLGPAVVTRRIAPQS